MNRGKARGKGWPKGVSGNPGGRPGGFGEIRRKARQHSTDALERLLLEMDGENPIAAALAAGHVLALGWGSASNARSAAPWTGKLAEGERSASQSDGDASDVGDVATTASGTAR